MDLSTYESLTGLNISTAQTPIVEAIILRTQTMIEGMLGFSLDPILKDTNYYTEIGKTASECPCDADLTALLAPDAVQYAYRVFNFQHGETYLSIDPATVIGAIKLVRNGVTYKTLTEDEYSLHYKDGYIEYIELCECLCDCINVCNCVQLAVDADWAFSTIPADLNYVWTDMITFYSNVNKDIKSQTLGTHSYTKFDNKAPETLASNLSVLKKYSGPNGSLMVTIAR